MSVCKWCCRELPRVCSRVKIFIIATFLRSPAPITTIPVGFSDPYGLLSLSINGVPVHSNLAQAIVYKISKHWPLQYWVDWKLTHMVDWEGIELKPF